MGMGRTDSSAALYLLLSVRLFPRKHILGGPQQRQVSFCGNPFLVAAAHLPRPVWGSLSGLTRARFLPLSSQTTCHRDEFVISLCPRAVSFSSEAASRSLWFLSPQHSPGPGRAQGTWSGTARWPRSCGLSASLVKGLVGEEARIPPPEIRFGPLCIPWTAGTMVMVDVLAVRSMNVAHLSFPVAE